MKTSITVSDRKEGDAIRTGLEDPAVRAFIVIMGALLTLPSDRARRRVLVYVKDRIEEEQTNNE
jgi:hypothetical protein